MLTRLEIDGFKSFERFSLDLRPLTAIVGPNASGKSNLFDAIRFISLLSQFDVRTAMQDLRGLPEELFRRTKSGMSDRITFALEVFLPKNGIDAFASEYVITAQRLRYEVELRMKTDVNGFPDRITVAKESCAPIAKKDDGAAYLWPIEISYNARISPFIRLSEDQKALEIRQDGRQKHGKPIRLPLGDASRTALSTITTSEFPHLYALKKYLSDVSFLEINPQAARLPNDIFEDKNLRPDASNLSAVLARIKGETATKEQPDGALADIAADLSSLIPSVHGIDLSNDPAKRQFSFQVNFRENLSFSSRVISDGTLRLLALLTVLNDPSRTGSLCFEEPENGVHEGRIPILIEILREATKFKDATGSGAYQILLNTHSPKVMSALLDEEIVAADSVRILNPSLKVSDSRTRMRTGVHSSSDLFDAEKNLTRAEVERLLQRLNDAA